MLKAADISYQLSKLQVSDQNNWRMKSDAKFFTNGAEALKKIPNHLHQGLKDSLAHLFKGMIEKIQQQSAISCKLVRVSAALDPAKMALLESESEQSLFDKIVDIMYFKKCISGKQGSKFNDFFKRLLSVKRLNLSILIKRLCILMIFLVFM